jgi:hypothetical protein
MLQRMHLKLQQLINELKPDGVVIDLDMLAELDDGRGGSKQSAWQQALNLFETKGIVFQKTVNMGEDGVKTKSAVTPIAYQQGSPFVPLLNSWAHYYNLIRESTGVNPARDGSMPSDALVGVNQLAQLASNTVTRDIVDCAVNFKKMICEVISTRLHSIYTYKDAKFIKEIYNNVLSKDMLDAVEVMKDRHLHEFGFTFEMYPTQEALNELKEDLAIAIKSGQIDVGIKHEALMIARRSIKYASEYLKMQIKRKLSKTTKGNLRLLSLKAKTMLLLHRQKYRPIHKPTPLRKRLTLNTGKKNLSLICTK